MEVDGVRSVVMDYHREKQIEDRFKLSFIPKGDYFIMDSDQLVSNPYRDMAERDVVDDTQRRTSISERLTSVRNSICANHFNLAKGRLEKEEHSSLRGLHETSSELRYHVKLLDLDRRRNTVEINKRFRPDKDYSYDEHQLETSKKRLGVAGECYYLQKSLKYPVRHSSLQNKVTPTLAEARKTLQRHKFELLTSPSPFSRATLSRSSKRQVSARSDLPSQNSQTDRFFRPSRSARSLQSSDSRTFHKKWSFLTQPPEIPEGSMSSKGTNQLRFRGHRFPDISKSVSSLQSAKSHRGPSGHKVKFAFPLKDKSYSRLDARILERSKTFHDGFGEESIKSCYMLDSDDEEPPPRKVNIRELIHGKETTRPSTQASSFGRRKRSTYNPPGHITQEIMERESENIRKKVNTFLNHVAAWDPTIKFESDSSSDEEEYRRRSPIIPKAHVTAFSRHFLSVMAEEEKAAESDQKKNLANVDENPSVKDRKARVGQEETELDNEEIHSNEEEQGKGDNKKDQNKRDKIIAKWKDIAWRVTKPDSSLRRLSTEDLILQRIMGIQVNQGAKKIPGVPIHSAGRALRHTPTFKMQKVVEDLMSGRTKFQQFEVDNLKKKLESGMDISELEEPSKEDEAKAKETFKTVTMDDDHSLSEISEEEEPGQKDITAQLGWI